MKRFRTILIIGCIEIAIGGITLAGTGESILMGVNSKPPAVLLFVILAAMTSLFIGIGLLRFKKLAYSLLLYFASVVFLSKILILLDVIHLNGALETTFPSTLKNIISIAYHGAVIYYLKKQDIKEIFHIWP